MHIDTRDNYIKITAAAIFLFSFLLLFLTTNDIGITCDEAWINDSAAHSFAQWMSLSLKTILKGNFSTFRSKETIEKFFGGHFHYHPPFGRIMHSFSLILFGNLVGDIKALRISPEMMFSIVCVLVFLITLSLSDYISAITASVCLLFMPRMFGHGHIFALDMPITFMWLLTIFFFIKSDEKRIYKVLFVVFLGLSFATKAHSLLIPLSILLWIIIFPSKKKFQLLTIGTLLGVIIFYIANPWLWVNLNSHIEEFISGMSSHTSDFVVKTYYLGRKYDSNAVPWHYPFVLSFFTIPAPILLFTIVGIISALKILINRLKNLFKTKSFTATEKLNIFIFINAFILFPVISLGFAPAYDGTRLFLPAFPFLAILSGTGFYKFINLIFTEGRKLGKWILASLIIASSAISLFDAHPFELSYYNIFSGGIKGAQRIGLETTYWGDAFNNDVISFMNERLRGKRINGRALFNSILFDYYHQYGILSNDIVYDALNYDYLLINRREGLLNDEDFFYIEEIKPLFSNKYKGTALFSIYKNK
ncbi:MAG: hypothetical protein D6734_10850, partial [Candidatus Schekmanbacteria bacterium]